MTYKVKIKIKTDFDFNLNFGSPNTQYKYKDTNGSIKCTLYYNREETDVIKDLTNFLLSLDVITNKEGLKDIFYDSVYNYTVELEKQGLHSNHNLLSGNYKMEIIIFKSYLEYL